MITDARDPWAVIRRLEQRISQLETSSPVEHASISRDGIRLLVPGENGDRPTKFGHDEATGKWGFLVKDGADYLTVQEMAAKKDTAERILMEQKIAALAAATTTNVTNVTNRVAATEAKVGTLESDMSGVKSVNTSQGTKIGALETDVAGVKSVNTAQGAKIGTLETDVASAKSRLTSAEAGIDYTANRASDLEGRMTSAEAGVTYTANRTGDLEDRMGAIEPRMATAENKLSAVPGQISASHEYPNGRIGGLEGRMSNVESGKVGNTAFQTLQGQVGSLSGSLAALRTAYNNHIDNYHGGGGKG